MTKRLTKTDWINCGLKQFAKKGVTALRAEPLAKKLSVSRGSFYWHFKNVTEFENEIMFAWKVQTTESVIKQLEEKLLVNERLQQLMGMSLTYDYYMDRAMRGWALVDGRAQKMVKQVDQKRIEYVESLLKEMGTKKNDIPARARILYWASLGQSLVFDKKYSTLSEGEIKNLLKLIVK